LPTSSGVHSTTAVDQITTTRTATVAARRPTNLTGRSIVNIAEMDRPPATRACTGIAIAPTASAEQGSA